MQVTNDSAHYVCRQKRKGRSGGGVWRADGLRPLRPYPEYVAAPDTVSRPTWTGREPAAGCGTNLAAVRS